MGSRYSIGEHQQLCRMVASSQQPLRQEQPGAVQVGARSGTHRSSSHKRPSRTLGWYRKQPGILSTSAARKCAERTHRPRSLARVGQRIDAHRKSAKRRSGAIASALASAPSHQAPSRTTKSSSRCSFVPVWVQKSAQAEVVMRQELEDGVNFISAAHRMGAKLGPQTTRRQQIQALDTVRFAVELNIGPIRGSPPFRIVNLERTSRFATCQ